MSGVFVQHVIYFLGRVKREGDWYVSECIGLPVASQGRTETEAMANLMDASHLFVETCLERGTLEEVLLKYDWKPSLRPPSVIPPAAFALPMPIDPAVIKKMEAWGR